MPNIELLHIDCMEYMATLPDKSFELAIVDPPYGIGVGYTPKARVDSGGWDNNTPDENYFIELFRVSKNQIIWGGNYFNLPHSEGWICWNKRTKNNKDAIPKSQFELAWSSFFDRKAKFFDYAWDGNIHGFNGGKPNYTYKPIHLSQKPVDMYRWILDNYANPIDKILDTHGGSRSLAIACHQMGFDHVSCEIDEDYHNESVKRFKEQTMQQSLFK